MIPYTIKNQEGESVSPMTSTKTVFDDKGVDIDTLLAEVREVPSQVAELAKAVEGKQDALSFSEDFTLAGNSVAIADSVKAPGMEALDAVNSDFEDFLAECQSIFGAEYTIVENYRMSVPWTYDAQTKKFTFGEVTDITIMQARIALKAHYIRPSYGNRAFQIPGLRFAVLPGSAMADYMFADSPVEEIMIHGDFSNYPSPTQYSFYGATKLRKIHGVMLVRYVTDGMKFQSCRVLQEVRLRQVTSNIDFRNTPYISLDSLSYLVANALNEKAITVTVHPDVYAKLTGDTTNAACAALTEEERAQWAQVLADANAKDISFATV